MINIFAALRYLEKRQVIFVALLQFEGAARSQWSIIKNMWDQKGTPWTWANFTKEFNDKYIQLIVQEKREDEFMSLKQGTKSVAEYEAHFTSQSKFAPELVATDQKHKRHFVQGLNLEIQKALAIANINTFDMAFEKAQYVEDANA